jgi:hypothetical protein
MLLHRRAETSVLKRFVYKSAASGNSSATLQPYSVPHTGPEATVYRVNRQEETAMSTRRRRQSKARTEGIDAFWALLVAVFADIGRVGA